MQGSAWKILFLALESALLFLFVHGILIASTAPYLDPANVQCQGELVCTTSTLWNVGLCGGKRGVGKDQYFKTERRLLSVFFPSFFSNTASSYFRTVEPLLTLSGFQNSMTHKHQSDECRAEQRL